MPILPAFAASAANGGLLASGVHNAQAAGPSGTADAARVVVFIDYQNAHALARDGFSPPSDSVTAGQFDPLRLCRLIIARSPYPRRLIQVRVYRGIPDPERQPGAFSASNLQNQVHAERGAGAVRVITRPLKYPRDWPRTPAREKGIDVALAVDFVRLGLRGDYDVGIIFSTDTDLEPALEAMEELRGDPFPRCEVAAWQTRRPGSRLSISGAHIWCHWLSEADYRKAHDPTDYRRPG
jgi:uncharacterized LabA/DUF88 family protein